jgi:hypothetical protein
LSKSLKNEFSDFHARGGILILLTRVALKNHRSTRSFTLDGGNLKEVELERVSPGKVVKGPEWIGAR